MREADNRAHQRSWLRSLSSASETALALPQNCGVVQGQKTKNLRSRLSGLKSLVVVLACSVLVTVTDASIVKLQGVNLDMKQILDVNKVHNVKLTLNRDTRGTPLTFWALDQCFSIVFNNPYLKQQGCTQSTPSMSCYQPFDAANPPKCTLGTQGIDGINCRIGENQSTLMFNFLGLSRNDFTDISFEFSNFKNPYSAITMNDIKFNVYNDAACTDLKSFIPLSQQKFVGLAGTSSAFFKISTSTTNLGNDDKANKVTFKMTPVQTQPDGTGMISITMPIWYTAPDDGSITRMYDSDSTDKCTSPDIASGMTIKGSFFSDTINTLYISYKDLAANKRSGQELTITCSGFRNPIYQKIWKGFIISFFDNEGTETTSAKFSTGNLIEASSADVALDTLNFTPATIFVENVALTPTIYKVNEFSVWTIALNGQFPIPLELGCYVELLIPKDLPFQQGYLKAEGLFFDAVSGDLISTPSVTVTTNGTRLRFKACARAATLGLSPQGILQISVIKTPISRRDTGFFQFGIYKDSAYQQPIAVLGPPGYSVKAESLLAGAITINSVVPDKLGVQVLTTYTFNFTTEHQLWMGSDVKIEFPTGVILPPTGTTVVVSPRGDSINYVAAKEGIVQTGNVIYITDIFGTTKDPPPGPLNIILRIDGIQNPYSSQPAGNFAITTLYDKDVVDMGVQKDGSFTPTSGQILGKPIIVTDPVTSGISSRYTLTFIPESVVPKNGFIKVIVPPELILRPTETLSDGACTASTLSCISVKDNIIWLKTQEIILNNKPINIVIVGVNNPRNFAPTGQFLIYTYDQDQISEIDAGFNINTAMSVPASITNFSVLPSNFTNGVINTYTFTITTQVVFVNGDKIQFVVPKQITLPASVNDLNITPLPRIVNGIEVSDVLQVEKNGQLIIITFVTVAPTTETYKWTLSKIQNPSSLRQSDQFVQLIANDKNGWSVQVYSPLVGPTITNQEPGLIQVASLTQTSLEPIKPTTYEIKFNPINDISSTGSIQIYWPTQVTVPATTTCTVKTNKVWKDQCIIDQTQFTITIKNVFSETTTFKQEVTITLVGVINPQNNKDKGGAFGIQTYDDPNLLYRIDKLAADKLFPTLDCDFPCKSCLATNRKNCQSCWTDNWSANKYFISNAANSGSCAQSCPAGQTRDNSSSYVCIDCDISCTTCKDEDRKDCTTCAAGFPYRLSGTGTCLESCTKGYYALVTDKMCATCAAPCAACTEQPDKCTACDEKSGFPVLFENKCKQKCDVGYTNIMGVCQKCSSPCAACGETIDSCTVCDGSEESTGSGKRTYFYSNTCYAQCPANSTPSKKEETLVCVQCTDPACELCDDVDTGICKRCVQGLFVHEGLCKSGCPTGYKINQEGNSCVLFTINDIGIIPFPFACAAFLGCVIASFGMCSKKPGRVKMISYQNTITCFIVIIAFVQFLAMIAMIIWAILFGTMFLFYAACGLTGALILMNVIYQIFFTCTFNRKVTPADKLLKYKQGKMTKAELSQFIVPSDEDFNAYVRKHGCISCFIAMMTFMCTFRCNKMYYSRFYSYDLFKAGFSQGKYYRKAMTIFCIVSMVIDGMIICLCIASLIQMVVMSNMLWITCVEVAALSLFLIIFGCIELYKMKDYLAYNEAPKTGTLGWDSKGGRNKFDVSSVNDFLDKDSREVMMKNLLKNVRSNQDMFLNNKLDDLLNLFGDRRCKSMIELGTGWDKEEDPRLCITWPLTPSKKADYDGDYKFTKNDMIGGFDDNVYAECKVKDPVNEVAVQGDQGQQDFMHQLRRKQGELLVGNMDEDDELANRKIKGKRRGRKNKYYTAIDAEDDEEADGQELSVNDEDAEQADNLAIIKEQEEEEEQLRLKVEEERKRQEAAQAERRAKLAEAERRRLEAEAAEEAARRLAEEEEERMRLIQEEEELARMRELEATRIRLAQEESSVKRKTEEEEEARRKKLAEISEANRAKYEAEEAARKKALEEEQARLKREQEELEAKVKAEQSERMSRKLQESSRLQAQRDEEELRLRKEQLEIDERKRQEEKEAERLRLETEANERRILAAKTVEEKRAAKLEEERIKREADELERQRRLAQAELERQEAIALEEVKRQKRLQEEDARRTQIEEEERLHREKLVKLEAERLAKIEADEIERRARLERMESARQKQLEEEDLARAEKHRLEAEMRSKQLSIEEEVRLNALALEEEKRFKLARAQEEKRLKQLQEDEEKRRADDERRKREEEDRILAEKEKIDQEKALLLAQQQEFARKEKERKEKELRDELDKIERDSKVGDEILKAKRQADEDAKRFDGGTQMQSDEELEHEIVMSQELIQDFNKQAHPVENPPNADSRTFNIYDILGELDRDDRGNIIVLQDSHGNNLDKTGHPTNIRGYLTDPKTGDVLENHTKTKLFGAEEIDEKGEVPAPFCVEKFNFNPHDLMGDLEFQYDSSTGRAIPQLLQTKQGFYVDKKGRRVNRFGWLVQGGNGHVVDKAGRKKFDRKQLDDGDLQKLLNYGGKRFDIKDVIGVFDKDANGNIMLQRGDNGLLLDNVGRRVNSKGYLIDYDGNIIDREGRVIFVKEHLKNGEFPKIFLFTKFNIDSILGDFEMSPLSEPILEKDKHGNFIDRKGRPVNSRGYLVDKSGNVIDKRGKRMFDKVVLTAEGEIPKIFRMQILKTDSGSSLSRLMDEIEKNQPSEYERVEEEKDEGGDGDTSMDSAMEDTPANYNMANQRFEEYEDYEAIPEESDRKVSQRKQKRKPPTNVQPEVQVSAEMPQKKTKKKLKKKKKVGYLEYLMPTNREVNMADAYGGQAKGQFRRQGVKYDKERLMNRIKTPANIPGGRAQLEALAATVAGFHKPHVSRMEDDKVSARGPENRPPRIKKNQFMGDSNDGGTSQMSGLAVNKRNQTSKGRDSKSNLEALRERKMRTQQKKGDMTDGDFEKMFGKDIDQYLEGSEFDLDEYDKLSQFSKGTGRNSQANVKLKAMEQVYLQRIESNQAKVLEQKSSVRMQGGTTAELMNKKQRSSQAKKPPAFREFQDRFVDQPDFIHRGEILEFETSKQGSSSKKKIQSTLQPLPLRDGPGVPSNFERQSKQRQ